MIRYYINLTNGIEVLEKMQADYRFIRIQSTACEQKRWRAILVDLDHDFFMNLALGNTCIVIDYSQNHVQPRAIFQGIEWVKFVLNQAWFDRPTYPVVRGFMCRVYFTNEFKKLDDTTLKKLRYFKKFLKTDHLKIITKSGRTTKDGDYGWYAETLKITNMKMGGHSEGTASTKACARNNGGSVPCCFGANGGVGRLLRPMAFKLIHPASNR